MILADSVYNLSTGAFDISLENLNNAWRFDSDNPRLPSEKEITAALNKSGWKKIEMREENTFSRREGVGFNFGAIAKGYAVDQAITILSRLNIGNALVNAGGDIRTLGKDWVVGIQHPRNLSLTAERTELNNFSIATSGDYEKYFETDGERYHHIFDPSSGYPAKDVMSVTILSVECVFADALSTAVFVMGVEKGLDLINQLQDTETMIIDSNGEKHYSSDFEKHISK
jgi:thiamine biosynthesis lipoprotein